MKRVVLLNGPARVGKNTAANALMERGDVAVIGFSHRLKRMVHGVYLGLDGWTMDPDAFDAVKGEPQDILSGMSWRQAYIHYSEQVIKPLHGHGWFGDRFIEAAVADAAPIIAVPDSGFRGEAERVVERFGAANVLLIRLHREGITFAGDSRGYISLVDLGVVEHDVTNETGHPNLMRAEIKLLVRWWLRGEQDAAAAA